MVVKGGRLDYSPWVPKNMATSLAVVEVKMVSVFYARRPNCVLI